MYNVHLHHRQQSGIQKMLYQLLAPRSHLPLVIWESGCPSGMAGAEAVHGCWPPRSRIDTSCNTTTIPSELMSEFQSPLTAPSWWGPNHIQIPTARKSGEESIQFSSLCRTQGPQEKAKQMLRDPTYSSHLIIFSRREWISKGKVSENVL